MALDSRGTPLLSCLGCYPCFQIFFLVALKVQALTILSRPGKHSTEPSKSAQPNTKLVPQRSMRVSPKRRWETLPNWIIPRTGCTNQSCCLFCFSSTNQSLFLCLTVRVPENTVAIQCQQHRFLDGGAEPPTKNSFGFYHNSTAPF